MNTLKLALGAFLAAGLSAAVPSASLAQYPGGAGAGQNSALAEQRRQIKEADAEVARIQKELTKIKSRIQAKYETKEDWETAKNNLKAAETAYESARKKAVAKLYASPEYKAAKDKQLKAEQSMQELQGNAKANPKDLEKAQADRLEAGIAVRNQETAALTSDPKVAEAKSKLDEAKKAWNALQDEVKEALKQDPEYLAGQEQLKAAQANSEQMKQAVAQAAAAERDARRAAAESQRNSRGSSGGRSRSGGAYGGGGGYR